MNKKKSGGLLIGLLLIIIGSVLLVYNEKNNVQNIKTVAEIEKKVVDVRSDVIDQKNDNKLIATNGQLYVEDEIINDPVFNVGVKTAKLERIVEVYQWEEKSEEENGETKYTYNKVWSNSLINSSEFNNTSYTNPKSKLYDDGLYLSSIVKVGEYYLTSNQVSSLSANKELSLEGLNEIYLQKDFDIKNKYITNSKDIDNPEIGDVRISYKYNDYKEISVLAVQSGNTFIDFVSEAGKTVNKIYSGKMSSKQIILKMQDENKTMKWLLRLGGILLVVFGYMALISGLNRLLEYIPILGRIASSIVSFVAGLIGLIHALVIIIIAWFRYRPVLSIILIGVIVLIVILIRTKKKKTSVENNTSQNIITNETNTVTPTPSEITNDTEQNKEEN